MSTSIEQRVVQMKFDNKQFQAGVAESMSTLEKFEQKLKLKDASKGFDDLSRAASGVSLAGLTREADTVSVKFDAMAVVAISALNRITNAAVNAGTNLVKSLSVDQVTAGFSKYEARTAAVQTLVNATGRSVEDIEKYMSKLMTYSDETSYGFADMTAALGTMVSAGGDIDKLVPVLEGFGNAVSFVGKGATEYSRAIIQLSQGYGRNALMLEDWKSIEQTLGGAKQLKEVFIDVGEELGKIKKGQIDVGTFNETLKDKWLDQEVIEQALGRFAEMTERAFAMIEAGEAETVSEAYEILSQTVDDYRIRAAKAAQEAKSFTEAIDATKDAVSTKWMESFQIIFGNYEEATKLWTELTNTLYDLFAASGDVRNEMLSLWKEMGGRKAAIQAVKNAFEALAKPLGAIKEAFEVIFMPGDTQIGASWLHNATVAIRDFWEALIMSDEAAEGLKTVVMALLLPVQALVQVVRVGFAVFTNLIKIIFKLGDALLSLPAKIDKVDNPLKNLFGDERYEKLIVSLTTIVEKLGTAFGAVASKISGTVKSMSGLVSSKLQASFSKLIDLLTPIAEWILDRIVDGFEILANFDYSKISDWAVTAIDSIVIGFSLIEKGCTSAIGAIKGFFASFEGMTALEVINSIITGVASLKTNMMTFIKSLGFDQIMESLRTEASGVADVIGELGEAVGTLVAKLTPGKILVFSFGTSVVWAVTAIAKAFTAFEGVGKSISGTFKETTNVLKAVQKRIKPSPILQVAVAIGVLAISLGALAQIDSDRLSASAIALGSLMTLLGVLIISMAAITKFLVTSDAMAKNLQKVSFAMIAMAGSVGILAGALLMLSKVNMEGMASKLAMLAIIMGVLGLASIAVAKLAPELSKGAVFLLFFALSIGSIASSLEALGKADLESVRENIGILIVIMTMLAALSVASAKVKFGSAAGLTLFIIDLLLFVKVLQKLSNVNVASLANGIVMFIAMFASLIPLAIMAKAAGKEMTGAASMILSVSASMILLSFAIESIGSLDLRTVAKGTGAIMAIMVMFAVLTELSQVADKGSKIAAPSFLAMSAAILVLGVAISYIGGLSLKDAVQGTMVVASLLTLFAVITKVAGEAKKSVGMIAAMTVVLGLITTSIVILTFIPFQEAIGAAGALAIAFTGLGIAFKAIEKVRPKVVISSMILIISALVTISLVVKQLTDLDSNSVLASSKALGILFLSIGTSFALLQQNKIFETASLKRIGKTLLLMLGMITMAGALISVLDMSVHNSNDAIGKASAIGIILLALGESMALFNVKTAKLGNMAKTASLMAAMTSIAGLAIGLLGNLVQDDPASLIAKAVGLSTILMAMTGAMAILSNFGLGLSMMGSVAPKAVAGAVACEVIIGSIVLLISGLGILFEKFDWLDKGLSKAEEIFPRMGLLIGSFVGNIIGGIINGAVIELIGSFGTALSNFATNVQGFISMRVDQEFLDSIFRLSAAILAITGAEFVHGLISFVGGGNLFSKFGQQLEEFGPYFANFASSIANIPVDAVFAASACLEGLGTMLAAIPTEGGLMGMIFGNKSLKDFGTGLSDLAQGIVDYAAILATGNVDEAAVKKSTSLVTMMSELAEKIPATGGLMTMLVDRDLGEFGSQLTRFALMMNSFIFQVNSLPDVDQGKFDALTSCTDVLVKLASKLPSTGGLVTYFAQQDIGEFGRQLVQFGIGMHSFMFQVNRVEDVDQTKFDNIVACAETLVELTKSIPRTGALITFFGGHDLGRFGTDIAEFGSGIGAFFKTLAVSGFNQNTVDLAKSAGLGFVEIANALGANDGIVTIWENTSLDKFGQEITKLGEGMAKFYEKTSDISWSDVSLAVTELERLVTLASSLKDINGGLATGFRQYLFELAKTGISEFTDAFSGAEEEIQFSIYNTISSAISSARTSMMQTPADYTFIVDAILNGLTMGESELVLKAHSLVQTLKTAVYSQAEELTLIGTFIILGITRSFENGASIMQDSVKRTMESAVKGAKDALRVTGAYSMAFYDIGRYSIDGYIKGLNEHTSQLYNKLKEIGNRSVLEFQQSVGVNSPSVKFAEIGMYSVLGFIKGIDDNAKNAAKSMLKMGENLVETIQRFFGIHSPSTLMRDEVGRYIIDGIADGISSNTSAEEAASKKAQNIVNAFKSEFDKWSGYANTADLEFQLWEAMNPNASNYNYTLKQMELLDKKLSYQAERTNAANAQYMATLKTLGENAKETQDAYNMYLQEQITLANLASELIDLQTNGGNGDYVTDIMSTFSEETRQTRKAVDLYGDVMMSIRDSMLEQGFALEEIEEYARNATGFIPKGFGGTYAGGDTQSVMDHYLSQASGAIDGLAGQIEVVIPQSINNASAAASTAGRSVGTTTAGAIAGGISDSSGTISNAISNAISSSNADPTKLYEGYGDNIIQGIIKGASDGIGEVGDTLVGGIKEAGNAFCNFLGINSPSTVYQEYGNNIVQGLANGIVETTPLAVNSTVSLADSTIKALQPATNEWMSVGAQMSTGLANGIASNSGLVYNAVSSMISRALSMTYGILDIHSPSREYYEIGQMMDQGLANGIIDGTSIVTNAVSQMLGNVQGTINSTGMYISPVIEDTGRSSSGTGRLVYGGMGNWGGRVTDYTQLLQWDASGNLIPVGYGNAGKHQEDSRWWIASSREEAEYIRSLAQRAEDIMAIEEARAAYERANQGMYQGTVEDLKQAIQELASRPPEVNFTQNNYSPESLVSSTIYRATKTALSEVSSSVSPTGQSLKSIGTGLLSSAAKGIVNAANSIKSQTGSWR